MKTRLSILLLLVEIEYRLIHTMGTLVQKIGVTKTHLVSIEFQIQLMIFLLSFALFCHIKYKDIPIRKYSKTHTDANNQLGGLKFGFFNVGYQEETVDAVNMDPIIPAS